MTASYRKTKVGEWVVMGPATDIKAGWTVEVHTKAGKVKTETIERVGRPFDKDGRQMAYGHIGGGDGGGSADRIYADPDFCTSCGYQFEMGCAPEEGRSGICMDCS